MTNRFAGFGDNGGVPFEKYTPAISRTAKPKNPTKPKSRLAHNEPIDDEIGKPAEAKKGITKMIDYGDDISRGPYHLMLDKMARARQAITGESYAKAFTECYCDPKNAAIRDGSKYDDLAKSFDSVYGTSKSLIPTQKPADIHKIVDKLALDRQSRTGETHAKAYTEIYTDPKNVALRNGAGVGKAAPADPEQDYVSPSARTPAAAEELDRLVALA
jgi:hypothetical protein